MIFQGEKIDIIKPKYDSGELRCLFFGGEKQCEKHKQVSTSVMLCTLLMIVPYSVLFSKIIMLILTKITNLFNIPKEAIMFNNSLYNLIKETSSSEKVGLCFCVVSCAVVAAALILIGVFLFYKLQEFIYEKVLERYGIRETPFSQQRLIRMVSNYNLVWGFANFLDSDIEITKVSTEKYYADGTMRVHVSYRKTIATSRDFLLPKSDIICQNNKIDLSYIDKIYKEEIEILEQKNI